MAFHAWALNHSLMCPSLICPSCPSLICVPVFCRFWLSKRMATMMTYITLNEAGNCGGSAVSSGGNWVRHSLLKGFAPWNPHVLSRKGVEGVLGHLAQNTSKNQPGDGLALVELGLFFWVSFKGVLTLLSQMTYSHPISISGLKQSKVFGGGSHFGGKHYSKP